MTLDRSVHDLLSGNLHETLHKATYLYPDVNQNPLNCYDNPSTSAKASGKTQPRKSQPNFLILRPNQKMYGFHSQLLKTPLYCGNGHILLPNIRGLGVELDILVDRQNLWHVSQLFLEMS